MLSDPIELTGCAPLILGCDGPTLGAAEAAFFARTRPLGFILFARNVVDKPQLTRLCADLRTAVGWRAPILIDQEGGRVQRMRGPIWHDLPPALDEADQGVEAFWRRGRIIAHDLAEVGIDVTCAPLADIAQADTHAVLRNRCYGTGPDTVVAHAQAMIDGLLAGGVLPVLKHLPGYGRGRVDSHLELPFTDATLETLKAWDFKPFRDLSHVPMGMSAHLLYTAIDADNPATTSPRLIALIRDEIGFDGLLMTDDISMQALSGTIPDRGIASLQAGCDIVLHCNGDLAEMTALADAVPPMSEAAQRRAIRALSDRPAPQPVDIAALAAKLNAG